MNEENLPDSAFLVLALLAEGETHGYELHRLAHERGFRFWTKLRRSSIYNALAALEKAKLIRARVRKGEGPDRKVYRITKAGLVRLRTDGLDHLARPAHPQSEIDLGIYVLPFLEPKRARDALRESLAYLRARAGFLEEQLAWCNARKLRLPALAFERPLLLLRAEIDWLERVAADYAKSGARSDEWTRYDYREPPSVKTPD
jgi:DNA-binding PadR family transcriptional regulator